MWAFDTAVGIGDNILRLFETDTYKKVGESNARVIRVGFMIAVAAGSLMRYYRVFPREDIKELLLRAVDDLIENGMLGNGVFYYKDITGQLRRKTYGRIVRQQGKTKSKGEHRWRLRFRA